MLPVFGIGNLCKNGGIKNRKYDVDHYDPVGWMAHSTLHPGVVQDGSDWCIKSAMTDTAYSSSYYVCLPIYPGAYTAYAEIKPFDAGAIGRLLMHNYSEAHTASYDNQVFQQDYTLTDGVWTPCLIQWVAPIFASALHFSPRSTDDKYVLVKNCKLARGYKSIAEMQRLVDIVPEFTVGLTHPYPV